MNQIIFQRGGSGRPDVTLGGNALDLRAKFPGGLIAQFWFSLQCAENNLVQPDIDLHPAKAGGGRLQLFRGQFAGQQLIENDSERIDVRAMIRDTMLLLLRRHVLWRAEG